jgi:hypothetical protein
VPKLSRQAGPVGLALAAWDVWRRLSPRQKRLIVKHAKRHGPRIAAHVVRSAKAAKQSLGKRPGA